MIFLYPLVVICYKLRGAIHMQSTLHFFSVSIFIWNYFFWIYWPTPILSNIILLSIQSTFFPCLIKFKANEEKSVLQKKLLPKSNVSIWMTSLIFFPLTLLAYSVVLVAWALNECLLMVWPWVESPCYKK